MQRGFIMTVCLLEVPRQLLHPLVDVHGANKISQVLLQWLFDQPDFTLMLVTTFSDAECIQATEQRQEKATCLFYNYAGLKKGVVDHALVPDIAISFGVNIQSLAGFRNTNGYHFPVMGLIHSLGFDNQFCDLLAAQPYLRTYDTFICPSENTQRTVIEAGIDPSHTVVMAYGIDTQQFQPIANNQSLKQQLGIALDRQVLLLLSRISPSKKMDIMPLLRVLPQLINQYPNLLLYVVGTVFDDDYVEQLKQFCKTTGIDTHVMWDHQPSHDHIQQYFQCSDMVLSLPDNCSETFGLAVIEAMACQKPVVIADYAGYKGHITDGVEGFYIPTYSMATQPEADYSFYEPRLFGHQYSQRIVIDLDCLLDKIGQLLKDTKLRYSMGEHARQLVEKQFSLSSMFNRYDAIIQRLIKQSKETLCQLSYKKLTTINTYLDHQVSQLLPEDTQLTLTDHARVMIDQKQSIVFFEEQWAHYQLIKPIMALLYKQHLSICDLYTHFSESKQEVNKNCLFLLKQYVVARV